MTDVSALIAKSLGVLPQKQAEVAAVADQKKQALATPAQAYLNAAARAEGRVVNRPQAQSPQDLQRMLLEEAIASGQFYGDRSAVRGEVDAYKDTAIGVVSGAANAVAGIGALGLGVVSDELGTAAAQGISKTNEWVQDNQSAGLAARRNAYGALNELDIQDNAAQFELDQETDSPLWAGTKRVVRDAIDGVGNAIEDPMIAGDGVASGIGSLLAGGPLSKGLKVLGVADNLAMPGAIGAMEAGGAYQQTVQTALDKGASTENANAAGLIAAAIQAPVGAATGALVSKFESAPLKVPNLRDALANIGRETLEEGIQSGSGQTAQNIGIKSQVDPNQSLTEGVGEQAGLGALYGMGTAGALQAPGASIQAVAEAARAAVAPIIGREDRIKATGVAKATQEATDAQNAAVASAPILNQELQDIVAAKGGDQAPQMAEYLTKLFDNAKFDPAEAQTEAPIVQAAVQGATDRFMALRQVAEVAIDPKVSEADRLAAGAYILRQNTQFEQLLENDLNAAILKTDEANPVLAKLREFEDVTWNQKEHPQIRSALLAAKEALESNALGAQFTDKAMSTPEGLETAQRTASAVVDLIGSDPGEVSTELLDAIIRAHSVKGGGFLTPEQKSTIDAASALVRATRDRIASMESIGLSTGDQVAYEAQVQKAVGDADKQPVQSAAAKGRAIMDAMRSGDLDLARKQLVDISLFAQHFQNKIAAYNANLISGRPDVKTDFVGLSKERELGEAKWGKTNPVWLRIRSEQSIENAQRAALDGRAVLELANGLAKAFPQLKVQHVIPVSLDIDPELTKTAAQIAKEYRVKKIKGSEERAKVDKVPVEEQLNKPEIAPEIAEEVKTKENTPSVDNPTKAEPTTTVEKSDPQAAEAAVLKVTPEAEAQDTVPDRRTNLIGAKDGKNWFDKAFEAPKEATSRLVGSGNQAFVKIMDALVSPEAFKEFIGRKVKHSLEPDLLNSYRNLLKFNMPAIEEILAKRLETFLSETLFKGVTMRDALLDPSLKTKGNPIQQMIKGKALNIVEQQDGKFAYNDELISLAMLAALQWVVTENARPNSRMDKEDLAKLLGVHPDDLGENALNSFNASTWTPDAVQSISKGIMRYWGVKPSQGVERGFTDGIPEAVAKELIETMEELGLIAQFTIDAAGNPLTDQEVKDLNARNKGADQIEKTYKRIIVGQDESLQQHLKKLEPFPDAIETLVLVEPEEARFIGEAPTKVSPTQMRNAQVKNTKQARAAIEQRQKTPHKINTQMVDLLESLGKDRVLSWFGAGEIDTDVHNKNHALSLKGENATIGGAYDALISMLAELRNVSAEAGVDPSDMPVYYAYNVSKVGRLQMQGLHNPQSSKLMREAILPTRVTLDMTKPENEAKFMLAVAQAWGVKVHKKLRPESVEEAQKLIDGELAPALEALRAFAKGKKLTSEQDQIIKDAFGKKMSFAAVHAALEYNRFKEANDRSAFVTDLYVEADGVTDGPINALVHLATGAFSDLWVDLVAKGGLFIGQAGMTVNAFVANSPKDLYEVTTDHLETNLKRVGSEITDLKAKRVFNEMLELMSSLFGDDLSFDGTTLTIKRGVAKNPLTITIYGSSANGIAGNVVDTLTSAFYEKLSESEQGKSNEAERLKGLIEALANKRVSKGETGFYTHRKAEEALLPKDRSNTGYTLTKSQLKNMRSNVLSLFVNPMVQSIEASIGDTLVARNAIKTAGLVQSIYLEHEFQKRIKQALADKKAADPSFSNADFLTQDEINKIQSELEKVSPFIRVGGQVLYPAGSENTGIDGIELSRSLMDGISSDARIAGPKNAGVATIPYLNIAAGDGQMMLNLFTGDNVPEGSLDVFDGVHLKLDTLEDDGRRTNQAVHVAWQNNPLAGLNDSFKHFAEAIDLSSMSEVMIKDLAKALNFDPEEGGTIAQEIQFLAEHLQELTDQAEARHRALAQVEMSVDHMASIEAPYQSKGESLEGMSDIEIAHRLNQLYEKELASIKANKAREISSPREEIETQQQANENAKDAETVGDGASEPARAKTDTDEGSQQTETPVVITSASGLAKLVAGLKIPAEQKNLLKEIVRSLQNSGWELVRGTKAQTDAYALEHGHEPAQPRPGQILKGYASFKEKRIYLNTDEAETLVHELLHASVTEKIVAHYRGQTNPEVTETVTQLETLLAEWMAKEEDLSGLTPEQRQAYTNALNQVRAEQNNAQRSKADNQAAALDEFLAWNLSNQDLIKVAQGTKVENSFARVVKRVLVSLKNLIWGRSMAPMVRSDMYSALRFNASVLINSGLTLQARASNISRFQSVAYGNSDRLTDLHKLFFRKITTLVNEQPEGGYRNVMQSKVNRAFATIGNKTAVAFSDAGFSMNMQEKSAFTMLMSVFATQAKLDPAALGRIQEVYEHVNKLLEPDNFITDKLNQAQEYAAGRKLQALRGTLDGKSIVETDDQGRSTLMPAFLALAMVNDEFRKVLSKMDLPKADRKSRTGLDGLVDSLGINSMDWVSKTFSGEGRNKPNVQAAIDALTQRLAETVNEQENAVARLSNPVDRVNSWLVDKTQKGSKAVIDKLEAEKKKTTNKAVKGLLETGRIITSVVNTEEGRVTAEGLIATATNLKAPKFVGEMLGDLIGRTQSNAPVFDMIKVVRAHVQAERQNARETIPSLITSKFKEKLSDDQWTHLFKGLAKADLASLRDSHSVEEILRLVSDKGRRAGEIRRLEDKIEQQVGAKTWKVMKPKAEQLAHFMNTMEMGVQLQKNAFAVAGQFGTSDANKPADRLVSDMDQLVSLYALDALPVPTMESLSSLVQDEVAGVTYALEYLVGQRNAEQAKITTDVARANHYKGYIPSQDKAGAQLIVALDSEETDRRLKGFRKVAPYRASGVMWKTPKRSYYFAPIASRPTFSAGIMQNVRQTASGVDPVTGFTHDGLMTAGRVVGPKQVQEITRMGGATNANNEGYLPIYDGKGNIVAYERGVDPIQQQLLQRDTHLARMLGVWRGRQTEEQIAQKFNKQLVERLHDVWEAGKAEGRANEFVDIFSPAELKKDPVLADAVRLFTPEAIEHIQKTFGAKGFMVRRDMINDAIGYRAASIGDAWTGNTRLPPQVYDTARKLAVGVFGADAYRYLATAEKLTQNLVSEARQTIVVRSVVVPVANFMANVLQLASRGVKLDRITRDMPKKLVEINAYVRRRQRELELEADLRAAGGDVVKVRKIETELQSIRDANSRMSIWPLIQAGEFTSISDAGSLEKEELSLFEGKLSDYISQKVDQLPDALKTAARYGMVSQDTALFQGLSRAVQYGDFLGKAIRYDHLIQEKKMSPAQALASINEEFINYDRLSGRFRAGLENMGLLWFYNFKIRSVKIALAMIRENPLHALLVSLVPAPPFIGEVGTVLGDNLVSMGVEGDLNWSIGPDMGMKSWQMNPWVNLLN